MKTTIVTSKVDNPIVNIKVPEYVKYKNEGEWFKNYITSLIPYDTVVVEDFTSMKLAYDLVNNDLSGYKEQLQSFCAPLAEEDKLPEFKAEEILPYNRIHNKINVFVGESLKRNDEHKIILLTDKAIKDKNEALKNAIRASIEETIKLEIEKIQMQGQQIPEREIQEYVEQMRTQMTPEDLLNKDFVTEWEIFYTKALKYAYYSQNLLYLKQLSLRHTLITDRAFFYVGWEYGEPVIKVLNPLFCGFHKSPDVSRVEKGDYFWYKQAITIGDLYNEYGNTITPKEMERIANTAINSKYAVDKRHSLGPDGKYVFDTFTQDVLMGRTGNRDKTIGQAMGSGVNRKYNSQRLIWKTHIEFKAFREVIFLTTMNEYGQEEVSVVDAKFTIPNDAMKYSFLNKYGNESERWEWMDMAGKPVKAEVLWIPRRYEVTRLGPDVYVNYREVPNQPINIDNPYKDFELSYKGRIFTNLNAKSISPVQRAIPSQFQYFYVKHIQNRELSKYQGYITDIDIDQIPDYFEKDEFGEPIPGRDKTAMWNLMVRKLGKNFYSSSQSTEGGYVPATRSPGSRSAMTGTAAELLNLATLLDFIDKEIGLAMGISPQREAMFEKGSNVGDNQMAVNMSHNITEIYFYLHADTWKNVLNDWLKLFRIYCRNIFEQSPEKKEHFIEYVTPMNTKELFKITPEHLAHTDIGLYLGNTSQDQTYRDLMVNYAQAFAQNAGEGMEVVSTMLKSLTSGMSPEEIHKLIQIESRKQQERQQRMQEMQQQADEKRMMRENELREDIQAHEIEKEIIRANTTLEAKAMSGDSDDISKYIEDQAKLQDMTLKEREQSRKERETDKKLFTKS